MSNNIASKDLIIDLICFSLITSNVEHLSMHLFVDHVFSFIINLLCVPLLVLCLFFLLDCSHYYGVFGILSQIRVLQKYI